ncbi:MAG TPA: hypothetical protein VIO62_06595 [Candidatus Dormibacteraeota bacterium]
MTRRYTVYADDDKKVLEVSDQPGPLVSVSAPPPRPGQAPATHPFLSASAYDPFTEGTLRQILLKSTSFDDFLAKLREAGYRVVGQKNSGA